MKVCMIHQPQVFPAMHWLNRYLLADEFVLMDMAQVNRRVGMAKYEVGVVRDGGLAGVVDLHVPLTGGHRSSCSQSRIAHDDGWVRKHVETLRSVYAKAPHRDQVVEDVVRLFDETAGKSFAEHGAASLRLAGERIGFDAKVMFESTCSRQVERDAFAYRENASQRVMRLVKEMGCDTYVCGQKEDRPYLNEEEFMSAGVAVMSQRYVPPSHGNLSWLHYYAWHGPECVELVRSGTER